MTLQVNHLPVLTWNALGLNAAAMDFPSEGLTSPALTVNHFYGDAEMEKDLSPDEFEARIAALGTSNEEEAVVAGKFPIYAEQAFPTGIGADVGRLMREAAVPGTVLTFPETCKPPKHITFRYTIPAGAAALVRLLIVAKKGSDASVLLYASSEDTAACGIETFVYLEEGARLTLTTVQQMHGESFFFHDIGGWGETDSSFTVSKLDLGAKTVYEGLNHTQAGDGSRFSADLGFLGLHGSLTDINYNDVFRGRQADGRMTFKGALMDGASKTFRGTIDFRQAATGCSGDEQEDVILLGDDVVNKTIPLILGEEEDVEGRHASTIGSLSDDMLFYMQTRGIDRVHAEELMVRASLAGIADKIPSDDIRCGVNTAIADIFKPEVDEA
ncbi:MAG: SufD family Fe-S cluster assembly protein [Clostridia bacterium]|nr:SufD family Fe-S cluster assembly protein [Clostridia bacterium]